MNEFDTYKIYILEQNNIPFYIGKSSNPYNRFYNHKIKYGSNINLLIIDDVEDWKFWEKHYISLYKSWGFKLLNKNKGGGGPDKGRKIRPKDKEWKNKLSIAHKNKNISEETKQKMSIAAKGKIKTKEHINNIKLGQSNMSYHDKQKWKINISNGKQGTKYILSKETKNKLSLLRSKPIIQYDLQNNFIQEYSNRQEASKKLNIHAASIFNCCSNRSKTAGNFIFKFKQTNKNEKS